MEDIDPPENTTMPLQDDIIHLAIISSMGDNEWNEINTERDHILQILAINTIRWKILLSSAGECYNPLDDIIKYHQTIISSGGECCQVAG